MEVPVAGSCMWRGTSICRTPLGHAWPPFLILIACLHAFSPTAVSQETTSNTMRGLEWVVVSVVLDEGALATAPPTEAFETYVELRLRQAGIEIVPFTSTGENVEGRRAILRLFIAAREILTSGGDRLGWAFTYSLALRQYACIRVFPRAEPSSDTCSFFDTWERMGAIVRGKNSVTVRDHVETLMDTFVNDYLKANP